MDNPIEAPDEQFENTPSELSPDPTYVEKGSQLKPLQKSSARLTEWKNEPSVLNLREDLLAARHARDKHVKHVDYWVKLRDGGKHVKKRRGRSSVRPKLVRRQAEWRYSSLSEPLLSSEKIFDVKPRTHEDYESAKQNEILLNWQFDTKLDTVKLINDGIRVLVDEGTLILRCGWKRKVIKEKKKLPVYQYIQVFEGSEEEQILAEALELYEDNPRGFKDLPEEIQASIEYSKENRVTAWAIKDGYEEAEVDKVIYNQPTLNIVDYRNIYPDPSCKGNIHNAKFVVASFETSKAELMKDSRYKNLRNVNWGGSEVISDTDHYTETPDTFNFDDNLRKRVIAYEYWGYYDIHGTGKLVPIVATWIDNQMIRMEENPYPDKKVPFEFIAYMPKKNSLFGEPDAELLEDNQAVVGAITRGMIDLMGRSANAQEGLPKGLLDFTNKRRWQSGDDYEYNPVGQNPTNAIIQHKFNEIPASALNMLNIHNQEAEGLTGVRAFSGGMTGEAYGDVAAGIRGALDAASKREMDILRRVAEGFKCVGIKIASMNAVFLSEEETVRVTNKKFIQIKREELKGNFDMVVDITTPEIDEKRAQDMAFMLQTLGPSAPLPITQMILAEIAMLKRMPRLSHSISNYEPEPDPIAEARAQLEVKELELKIAKIESEIARNRAQAEKFEAEADSTDLDTELRGSGITHQRDLERQTEQARGNQDLEITKSLTQNRKPEDYTLSKK